MIKHFWIIIIGIILQSLVNSQSYNWPCQPFDQQHWINGTFCEARSGSLGDIDHFHDGIDIHLSEGGAVYSVVDEVITSLGSPGQYGINSWVRAGRYAYVHVIPNNALSVGDSVEAFVTILGWTNSWNHIHFKDGYPGSEINAIRASSGISPLIDNYNPHTDWVRFYQNNSTVQFSNNRVSGQIDIVCNAADHTDDGPLGDNNGIYKIGYEILDQSGEFVYGPYFPFQFDQIPYTDNYVTNVFFAGSNTSTYNYIITNRINSDFYLDVSQWDTGVYIVRVLVFDHYFNADTTDVEFEVMVTDTTPPIPPHLLFILPENDGFFLKWNVNPEEDLAGYRLYFSYDMEQWYNNHNETILTSDLNEFHAGAFSNSTGYFKLTAIDNAAFPNESAPSDIYAFRKNQNNQGLLLIDAYNDGISPNEPFVSNAGIIAANFDMGINTIHHSSIIADSSSQIPDGFTPIVLSGNKQTEWSEEFMDFLLDTSFCIIGSQSLTNFYSTDAGSHFLDSIGVSLAGNISPPNQLFGIGEPFIDFNSIEIINVSLFDSLNVFVISPDNNMVIPVLQDSNENTFATASPESHFIISSIPLELLGENERRNYFFRIASYFTGITAGNIDENEIVPHKLSMSFYPNPFNYNGYISFDGPQGKYSIRMYNVLGQSIWHENMFINKGIKKQYKIPSEIIDRMSSGVYFIHISSLKGKIAAQKILYLK